MTIKGLRKPLEFDKVIVAWGAEQRKLAQTYSNVHYIEDRFSHAKIHNELIRAKNVVILGDSLDTFQIAQATRDYLDQLGHFETKVTLMSTDVPDVRRTLGDGIERVFRRHLSEQRINYIPNAKVTRMEGDTELEKISFYKEEDHVNKPAPDVEYFIQPGLVIASNGIEKPRRDLSSLVGAQEQGSERRIQTGGESKIPHVNVRFSLIHNDVHSPILGVGPAVEVPSFIFKDRARSDNVGFNMEAGFFAGLKAMDKRVEFRHIPHTYMTLNERPIHFIGEAN